ncbi:MAG: TlpA family protein disulfide reductase, partial [Bacteroidales bacterium]|nr:TlpA family protein disulfide reductase [Bacteroidales bacterium]
IRSKRATEEGKKFTDFTIVQDPQNPETSTVRFSDYAGRGKYLLVDFWASWCGPCKAEIPNIKAVYEKYAGEKFDVLSIAVWDDPAKTAVAAREEGVVWNQIVNAKEIPTDIYGIEGIPHIMLIGPDGTIIKRDLRGAEIEATVAKYVQAK